MVITKSAAQSVTLTLALVALALTSLEGLVVRGDQPPQAVGGAAADATTPIVQGLSAAGEPVGASVTNGTVSFAPRPPSEIASAMSPSDQPLIDKLAGVGDNKQPAAEKMKQLSPAQQQQVGAMQKLLGFPRPIPESEVLAKIREIREMEEQAAAAHKKKQEEKSTSRIFKLGIAFGRR